MTMATIPSKSETRNFSSTEGVSTYTCKKKKFFYFYFFSKERGKKKFFFLIRHGILLKKKHSLSCRALAPHRQVTAANPEPPPCWILTSPRNSAHNVSAMSSAMTARIPRRDRWSHHRLHNLLQDRHGSRHRHPRPVPLQLLLPRAHLHPKGLRAHHAVDPLGQAVLLQRLPGSLRQAHPRRLRRPPSVPRPGQSHRPRQRHLRWFRPD